MSHIPEVITWTPGANDPNVATFQPGCGTCEWTGIIQQSIVAAARSAHDHARMSTADQPSGGADE